MGLSLGFISSPTAKTNGTAPQKAKANDAMRTSDITRTDDSAIIRPQAGW